jgi:hypothetical protein
LELSKGYYEVPIRPKRKVDFEVGTTPKPVFRTGEGLLLKRIIFGLGKNDFGLRMDNSKTKTPDDP